MRCATLASYAGPHSDGSSEIKLWEEGMRPDLFTGHAQRDDSHRILARLANGGMAPTAARQWSGWDSVQRARMAAVIALLAVFAAAWVWLQDVGDAPPPLSQARMQATAPPPGAAHNDPPPLAATIVNEPDHPAPAMPQAAAVAARAATPSAVPVAAARPVPRLARPQSPKTAVPPRAQRGDSPQEGDEDVTLLTAMLKHANGQKPAPTPPKD